MAYIGHRCGCGHTDLNHSRDAKKALCTANGGRSCGRGCRTNPKSQVLPTWDHKGRPVERVVPPGEGLATPTGNDGVRTCNCDSCKALYAELAPA